MEKNKNEQNLRTCETVTKDRIFVFSESQKERKRAGIKRYSKT